MNKTLERLIICRETYKQYLSGDYNISEDTRKYYQGNINGLSIAIGIIYDEEEKAVEDAYHSKEVKQ